MNTIMTMTISVFFVQLIFIGTRTWNVNAIAERNLKSVLLSGAIIHIAWLISISIGATSVARLMEDWDMRYIPVIIASLSGGLLGSYLALMNKWKKK